MFACLLKDKECQYSRILLDEFYRNCLHHRSRNWILPGNTNNSRRTCLEIWKCKSVQQIYSIFEFFSCLCNWESVLLKKKFLPFGLQTTILNFFKEEYIFKAEQIYHLQVSRPCIKEYSISLGNSRLRDALGLHGNEYLNLMWNTTSCKTNQHWWRCVNAEKVAKN